MSIPGEVYRARDTKAGRDVAIKVLPEAVVQSPERLARFEREAQLLASLNHPNIATIHGLEEHEGIAYLVMGLVPGETLAERLGRGSIPEKEAVELARQIIDGLEALLGPKQYVRITGKPNSYEDSFPGVVGEARELFPLVQSPFLESNAQFSPAGGFIVYDSNESGRSEV